jgi:hypothetical protein
MGGHIQKTGGRWRIDYRDGRGRRHRATFDTRKEADNALTDIKSRIGKGEYVASKFLPKFRELAEDWFRSKGDRRPGTVGNWRAQIDLHLNPKLGDLRLDRIDVALIEKLRDELRAKLSAKSVNALLTTAAAIFKLAVRGARLRPATLPRTLSAPSWARLNSRMRRQKNSVETAFSRSDPRKFWIRTRSARCLKKLTPDITGPCF